MGNERCTAYRYGTGHVVLSRGYVRKHLQIGVNKGAITQEAADKQLELWLAKKETKVTAKVEKLQQDQAARDKERLRSRAKS